MPSRNRTCREPVLISGFSDTTFLYCYATLRDVYRTLRDVRRTSRDVCRTLRDVRRTLPDVYATLRDVYRTLRDVHRTLRDVHRTSRDVHHTLRDEYATLRDMYRTLPGTGGTGRYCSRKNGRGEAGYSIITGKCLKSTLQSFRLERSRMEKLFSCKAKSHSL